MREEYDLASAVRGSVLENPGKTRFTILVDQDVVDSLRRRVKDTGRGYQTVINQALREYLASDLETAARSSDGQRRKNVRR